jgi:hypothetical protein
LLGPQPRQHLVGDVDRRAGVENRCRNDQVVVLLTRERGNSLLDLLPAQLDLFLTAPAQLLAQVVACSPDAPIERLDLGSQCLCRRSGSRSGIAALALDQIGQPSLVGFQQAIAFGEFFPQTFVRGEHLRGVVDQALHVDVADLGLGRCRRSDHHGDEKTRRQPADAAMPGAARRLSVRRSASRPAEGGSDSVHDRMLAFVVSRPLG